MQAKKQTAMLSKNICNTYDRKIFDSLILHIKRLNQAIKNK